MIPRRAIATASALALLSSTAIGPFASRTLAMHAATAAGTRTSAVSVARRYFGILDHQGLSGHDYHALNRLYAPGITLTESLTSGRPRTHRGLRQVQAFDRWMRLDWIVDRVEQRSPSVVLTIERSRTSPGHEGVRADP